MQNDKKWVCVEIPLQVTDIRVWAALTDPKLTQRYMYNCQLHSSWEVGSDAIWKEEKSDGTFTIHVRAKVLEFTPHTKLRFLIFHENKEFGAFEKELEDRPPELRSAWTSKVLCVEGNCLGIEAFEKDLAHRPPGA